MEPEKKSNGALIGSIVILVLLLLGGVYVWQSEAKKARENREEQVSPEDQAELDQVEKDLNSADVNIGASAIGTLE